MEDISKAFYFLATIFLLLSLVFNLVRHMPKLPGDILINKPGMKLYIPLTSTLILSIILSLLLNLFGK